MYFSVGASTTTVLGITAGTSQLALFSQDGPLRSANSSVADSPARVSEHPGDGGAPILELAVAKGSGVLDVTASGAYDRPLVQKIVAEVEWANQDDPAAWPALPVFGGK